MHSLVKKALLVFCFFFLLSSSFALFHNSQESPKESLPIPNNYSEIIASIELKTPFKPFKKCNLVDKKTKKLITAAILIKQTVNENEFSLNKLKNLEIAIPNKDLDKVINNYNEIIAVPAKTIFQQSRSKRKSYEIVF